MMAIERRKEEGARESGQQGQRWSERVCGRERV